MSEEASSGPGRAPGPGAKPAPQHSAWRVVLAATVAIAASAGLAWWFAVPDTSADLRQAPPPEQTQNPQQARQPAPAPPVRYAAAQPDPEQVRGAWQDVQTAYSEGGAASLEKTSAACAKRLPADPTTLDYCVAFDIYASQIVPAGQDQWFADAGARDLALARTALPASADAANRIQQVNALTRTMLAKAPPAARPKAVRAVRTHVRAPAHPSVQKAHAPARRAVRPKAIPKAIKASTHRTTGHPAKRYDTEWCALGRTEADRMVCADTELADADRRMKSAYNQAIASGVDPQILGEEQESWRAARDRASDRKALRDLYRSRIQDLESLAPPH